MPSASLPSVRGSRCPSAVLVGSAEDDPVFAANQMAVAFFRSSLKGSSGGARPRVRRGTRSRARRRRRVRSSDTRRPGGTSSCKHARASGVKEGVLDGGGSRRTARGRRARTTGSATGSSSRCSRRPGRPSVSADGPSGDAEPKYLNSPETRVYRKSHYLYGLNQARQSIRMTREAILVEGYMDVLSSYRRGSSNAIASAGTALTREQAKIIDRYADKVFVAYDGDDAGLSAATRAAEALVELGLKVRVALLPDGNDPDSYVRKYGADATPGGAALPPRISSTSSSARTRPTRADGREQAARALIETVSHVADPIKADLMLEKVAEALSLRHGAVVRLYEAKRAELTSRRPRRRASRPWARTRRGPSAGTSGSD